MSLYHDAPYTLEAHRSAPAEALPAAGYTDAMAAEAAALENAYLDDELIVTVTPGAAGTDTTLAFSWGDKLPGEDFVAQVNWGDGVSELADNIDGISGDYTELHAYDSAGEYWVTVTITSLGPDRTASLQGGAPVTIV